MGASDLGLGLGACDEVELAAGPVRLAALT